MVDGEHLSWYVLSAVDPLYENMSGVRLKVKTWSKEDGFSFSDAEIRHTLENLIALGFVDSWILAVNSPQNRRTTYHSHEAEELWFLITAPGEELLVSLDEKLRRSPPSRG